MNEDIEIGDSKISAPAKATILDVDGDCIPDYVVINVRWLVAGVISLITSAVGYALYYF